MVALYEQILCVEFFHIEMASRAVTALDRLNHIIDATFSSIEQFERFNRYTTLDRQLEDELTSHRNLIVCGS